MSDDSEDVLSYVSVHLKDAFLEDMRQQYPFDSMLIKRLREGVMMGSPKPKKLTPIQVCEEKLKDAVSRGDYLRNRMEEAEKKIYAIGKSLRATDDNIHERIQDLQDEVAELRMVNSILVQARQEYRELLETAIVGSRKSVPEGPTPGPGAPFDAQPMFPSKHRRF